MITPVNIAPISKLMTRFGILAQFPFRIPVHVLYCSVTYIYILCKVDFYKGRSPEN